METQEKADITARVVKQAKALGASLAGIADVAALQDAPSYQVSGRLLETGDAKSALVLALAHPVSKPELDWWDAHDTPGNRLLNAIALDLVRWLDAQLEISAHSVPYGLSRGGVFLKDAAALAGLGIIGKNNLLIVSQFGPRVRLKALFLGVALEPTGPIDFAPCEGCAMPCRQACPQDAFGESRYSKPFCKRQMAIDEANLVRVENWQEDGSADEVVKYCRACELACPVGC